MSDALFPEATREMSNRRAALAPDTTEAFRDFSSAVFEDRALPRKTKELIAVAVAHTTQCEYCIPVRAERAREAGASDAEIMEAIWVAAEMRTGGAYAHAALALDVMADGDE